MSTPIDLLVSRFHAKHSFSAIVALFGKVIDYLDRENACQRVNVSSALLIAIEKHEANHTADKKTAVTNAQSSDRSTHSVAKHGLRVCRPRSRAAGKVARTVLVRHVGLQ